MDKLATNNLIVSLKKEAKKAKAMVAGNLVRKINTLKSDKEKELAKDPEQRKKLDAKIDLVLQDIKLVKTLDTYMIAKRALLSPDVDKWKQLVGDSKVAAEERLIARVIQKNAIQKLVKKFIEEHKDYSEWLSEYFEFREKKKDLEVAAQTKKKPRAQKLSKSNKAGAPKHATKKLDSKQRDTKKSNIRRPKQYQVINSDAEVPKKPATTNSEVQEDKLHPSWQSKRKEKELLKAAFSGINSESKKIKFD